MKRRKKIGCQTQELVAGLVLEKLFIDHCWSDHASHVPSGVTLKELCDVAAECGIAPAQLAAACALMAGGTAQSIAFYDKIDAALSTHIGDEFSQRFLDALTVTEKLFVEKGCMASA